MTERTAPAMALVSVVLPVHNGERFVAEAVESVLNQNYRSVEIIVIDDGSTDATADVVRAFGPAVHYFHQQNAGPAAARNNGIRRAGGEFITFIDADDVWPAGRLLLHLGILQASGSADIVQGPIQRIRLLPDRQARTVDGDPEHPFLYTNLGSMTMRRDVFDRVGSLDESLRFHEDTDFWLRAREQNLHIHVVGEVALFYRLHGRNMTGGQDIHSTGFLRVVHRSVRRRREARGLAEQPRNLPPLDWRRSPDHHDRAERNGTLPVLPLLTVVMCRGDEHTDLAMSVRAVQEQHYQNVELLVVGKCIDAVSDAGWKSVWRLEHLGSFPDVASGLNTALQRAAGELIAFLLPAGGWPPGTLLRQARYLMDHPEAAYVLGRTRHILEPATRYNEGVLDGLAPRRNFGDRLGTLMARRMAFEIVGGFRMTEAVAAEADWLLRAMDAGLPRVLLPDVAMLLRVAPDERPGDEAAQGRQLLESLRGSILRKRAGHARTTPPRGSLPQ